MVEKINAGLDSQIVNVASEGKLSEKNTSEAIKALSDESGKGWFGGVFGTNSENTVMYVTLTMCVFLMIIGVGVLIFWEEFASEFWKYVFPIITSALGYMFGKSSKE